MAGTIVEPIKANHGEIALDLSAGGRSGGRGETRRRPGGQEDRKTDGGERVGEGEIRGGTSPAGALAH